MNKKSKKNRALVFKHFSRKGAALLSCFHKEIRIGVLSVATLASATPRLMAAPLSTVEGSSTSEVEALNDTLVLNEAKVSATRAPLAAAVAARQVTTLTCEDLAASGVQTINDVLKLSAAVDVRQRGGFGIQTDISIDGGTHDQIAILLNGVSIVNPQTGHNAADFPVNLSDIERIEILEGASSRVMGSQAFSGAINIVTHSVKKTSPLFANFEAGSYGTLRGEVRTAYSWGKGWGLSTSGSYQRSDGAVENGDFKGGRGFGQLSYDSPDLQFRLQIGATANDFGANTFYSAAYPNQWEATRRYILSAKAETQGRVHFSPQISWLRSLDHFQLTKDSEMGENFHRGDVFTASLNTWTEWKLGRTSLGAELREEAIYSTNLGRELNEEQYVGIPHNEGRFYTRHDDRTNISYFLEHNIVLRQFTFSLGVMGERNNAIDSRFRFYPGIDFSYRPTQSIKLYASWNKSLRLPSFTDLWYKSPTQEGNVGLLPEECWALRVGADFSNKVVQVKVKGHFQRGTHMIDWIMRTADDIYHATSFSLDNYGAGFDMRLNVTEWLGKKQPFQFFTVSYAWIGQHRRAGEDYFKSNYAMEYLRHKFVARLSHRIISHLGAEWTFRVQQREGSYLIYKDLKPTAELQPYGTHALLDARLQWKEKKYSLYVDLSNITNHHYYDLANVRQPGIIVLGGAILNL